MSVIDLVKKGTMILMIIATILFVFGVMPRLLIQKGGITCVGANSTNLIYECNPYTEPYYSCPPLDKFYNATGLYCGQRLVCENKWKKAR